MAFHDWNPTSLSLSPTLQLQLQTEWKTKFLQGNIWSQFSTNSCKEDWDFDHDMAFMHRKRLSKSLTDQKFIRKLSLWRKNLFSPSHGLRAWNCTELQICSNIEPIISNTQPTSFSLPGHKMLPALKRVNSTYEISSAGITVAKENLVLQRTL